MLDWSTCRTGSGVQLKEHHGINVDTLALNGIKCNAWPRSVIRGELKQSRKLLVKTQISSSVQKCEVNSTE